MSSEEGGLYIYSLKIPNKKLAEDVKLTVSKTVTGNMGSKVKDFTFTFTTVDGDQTEYSIAYSDGRPDAVIKTGETFTLSHGDSAEIKMKKGTSVTIAEDAEDYKASYKIGDAASVEADSVSVDVNDDTTLAFTNAKQGVVPTGVWISFRVLLMLGIVFLAGIAYFWIRRKRTEAFLRNLK